MFSLRLDNSTSPGNVAQVSAQLPRDGWLVGIDWSLIGITGTGQLQATVSTSSSVTVPSLIGDNSIVSHLATVAPGAASKFTPIPFLHFPAGSLIWNSLYASPSVGGNYVAITLFFEELLQPVPRDQSYIRQSRPRIEDNPGIPELIKGLPELVRVFKRSGDDVLNPFSPTWQKWMGQHVITLRAAWECLTDAAGDFLGIAELIATNPYLWSDLAGDPLTRAIGAPDLRAKDLWRLLGIWFQSGLQGLVDQITLVGQKVTGVKTVKQLIAFEGNFRFYEKSFIERALILLVLRALPWDSLRESRYGTYRRRTPLLEERA